MKKLKKLRKRGLALFLALVMCLSLVQVTAFAAETEDEENTPVLTEVEDEATPAEDPADAEPVDEEAAPVEEEASEEVTAPVEEEVSEEEAAPLRRRSSKRRFPRKCPPKFRLS